MGIPVGSKHSLMATNPLEQFEYNESLGRLNDASITSMNTVEADDIFKRYHNTDALPCRRVPLIGAPAYSIAAVHN